MPQELVQSATDLESGSLAVEEKRKGKSNDPLDLSWKQRCLLLMKPWWLSILLIFIPFAWASHWLVDSWGHEVEFVLCFISIIPLQNIFEVCGEQLAEHAGADLGEFICITFKNCVEATLALILLRKCHLRLLQSTIVGVVVLHLLLVQGMTFLIGGSQTRKQTLHDHHVAVNPSLLMVGVLSTVLPTAFFASLDRGHDTSSFDSPTFSPLVGDALRDCILKMSRGMAFMLLLVTYPCHSLDSYVASRVYRHVPWPPAPPSRNLLRPLYNLTGGWNPVFNCGAAKNDSLASQSRPATTRNTSEQTQALQKAHARVPLAVLTLCIVISIAVMCVTAEFLVESIDPVRERSGIQAEWFGLVLLPLVSFLPEAALALIGFITKRKDPKLDSKDAKSDSQNSEPDLNSSKSDSKDLKPDSKVIPDTMARGTPIDLSIQFTLWWMPVIVLIGWWTGRPMHLLFDYYEVALMLGTCFLVNYVTADGQTNIAEGFTMFIFYAMLATATWFYPGQPQVAFLLNCPGSVAEAVANGVENAIVVS
ncbi:hypothetical protein BN946_scf184998.g23 [Trametes cinnabarina]|uniref:Sodium/calcium exchanger membrane region domain-containing protein n=1 Tax=Pycnoporus cinnabarinus TaxID=5643 RepID=A0A060S2W6_PYCCI|nr:hypothetical protein BN946_scf184998.g23 [Trametes cinnabarina]